MTTCAPGRLAILAGIDGAGKSTVLNGLRQLHYATSYWRDLSELGLAASINFRNPAHEVSDLSGIERARYVNQFICAEWDHVISPAVSRGQSVVSDGYFIRMYGKERCFDRCDTNELLLASRLTGRELYILVDITPEMALARKPRWSPYEGYDQSQRGFLSFQERLRATLLEYLQGRAHVVIDGGQSATDVLRECVTALAQRGWRPNGTARESGVNAY